MYGNKDFIKLLKKEIKTYINDEKCYDSVKQNEKGILDYLNNIKSADIKRFAENISENECLYEEIREIICYELYKDFHKGE